MTVEWREIPGTEGLYEASDDGRIRSLDRVIERRGQGTYLHRGRVLKPLVRTEGYHLVNIHVPGKMQLCYVHRLVAQAFLADSYFPGACVLHWDGNPANNTVGNLRWGTHADNMQDTLRHGTHGFGSRTKCPQGHEYTPENTKISKRAGGRTFRACRKCHRRVDEAARRRAGGQPRKSALRTYSCELCRTTFQRSTGHAYRFCSKRCAAKSRFVSPGQEMAS